MRFDHRLRRQRQLSRDYDVMHVAHAGGVAR
jgi:hypothetical protein